MNRQSTQVHSKQTTTKMIPRSDVIPLVRKLGKLLELIIMAKL